jgi:hypothetical protein
LFWLIANRLSQATSVFRKIFLVRRAYLRTSCVRRIFIAPLVAILHAGGLRFCPFAHTSVRRQSFLAEYYGLAREGFVLTIDNPKKGTDWVGLSLAGHVGFQRHHRGRRTRRQPSRTDAGGVKGFGAFENRALVRGWELILPDEEVEALLREG